MNKSLLSPFRSRLFLAVWLGTLFSNFGMQIHTMSAGWLMLQLDPSPQMVALVQVAASLPYMLFALLAGALSDIYDKRQIMLLAQLFSLAAAALLAYLTKQDLINPWSLLLLVLMIATGASFFTPAWAASLTSQVPRKHLPEAISLNAINYNIGRSLAPALGGFLITAFGIAWAFILSTLSYFGIIAVLLRWAPEQRSASKPDAEPIFWAIRMGIRYAMRTDHIRIVIIRTILCSFGAAIFWALMPVLAKQHLGGDAITFTMLLTAFGVGSIVGGLLVTSVRNLLGVQRSSLGAQLLLALSGASVVFSTSLLLSSLSVFLVGVAWMIFIPTVNASIQMSAPDWIVGRLLALYQCIVHLSFALGGLAWGWIAAELGVSTAFILAGGFILLSCLYGIVRPMQDLERLNNEDAGLPGHDSVPKPTDPGNSPIVISVTYRVADADLASFLQAMAKLKPTRLRLGALDWTLEQDLDTPELWIERYRSKDWEEVRRRPQRYSQHDNDIRLQAAGFDVNASPTYSFSVIRQLV